MKIYEVINHNNEFIKNYKLDKNSIKQLGEMLNKGIKKELKKNARK